MLGCNKSDAVSQFDGRVITLVGGAGECKLNNRYPVEESMDYYHYIVKVIDSKNYTPSYSLVTVSSPKENTKGAKQLLKNKHYHFVIDKAWSDAYVFESIEGNTVYVKSCKQEE
jgi:hypothetical protein